LRLLSYFLLSFFLAFFPAPMFASTSMLNNPTSNTAPSGNLLDRFGLIVFQYEFDDLGLGISCTEPLVSELYDDVFGFDLPVKYGFYCSGRACWSCGSASKVKLIRANYTSETGSIGICGTEQLWFCTECKKAWPLNSPNTVRWDFSALHKN
jgi:hypothetical protein